MQRGDRYAFSPRIGRLALSCRRRVGLAPGWGARARSAHSDRRKCPRRSGAHSGFGTRRKSPRADARLHVYGNPNTATCWLGVDTAVSRFRDECVGNGTADSSGFRISDRRRYRAPRDRRGTHPGDIHSLGLVALRNCASNPGRCAVDRLPGSFSRKPARAGPFHPRLHRRLKDQEWSVDQEECFWTSGLLLSCAPGCPIYAIDLAGACELGSPVVAGL